MPTRRSTRRLAGAAVLLLVAGVTAACVPAAPPSLSTGCAGTVGIESSEHFDVALSPDQAEAAVLRDLAEAADRDSAVPLQVVIAETTPSGLEIRTQPAADGPAATQVARDAAAGGTVVAVDLDSVVQLVDAEPTVESSSVIANALDPGRELQWALDRVPFESAWTTEAGHDIIVAVVDSGIDATHPDLVGRVLQGVDFVAGNGTPAPGGRIDPRGHGTGLAGMIGALVGNGIGISGAVRNVRLLPVRVLDHNGTGTASDAAAGIVWAADHGAKVINLSFGSFVDSAVERSAIAYARSKGVVLVASAGNDGPTQNRVQYPGANPNVIAVGSTTELDAKSQFSTAQRYVALGAPGEDIVSLYPNSQYARWSGTSMAAAYASAAAALLKAKQPTADPGAIRDLLLNTGTDLGAPGWDRSFGCGLIDPEKALALQAQG